MATSTVLTVNGGSSSLKCALFELTGNGPEPILHYNVAITSGDHEQRIACLHDALEHVRQEDDLDRLAAVGHRVVHGGDLYDRPQRIDDPVMTALRGLETLAPLHQPVNLDLIDACRQALPHLPQVACFDTAFHRAIPADARHYALPREMTAAGLHVYGFHGISYEFIWSELSQRDAQARNKRIIVAHLGAGSSLCAIRNGISVATTMGFSTADGLPMATRTGSLDPGLLIHLMRERGMTADELEQLIYRDGGLRAVSGISGDMLELRASTDPRAREAIDLYTYRIVREIGGLAAALQGLDTLVFTGGIGANDTLTREAIVERLRWLLADVEVLAIAANEESMIATHTARLLAVA